MGGCAEYYGLVFVVPVSFDIGLYTNRGFGLEH